MTAPLQIKIPYKPRDLLLPVHKSNKRYITLIGHRRIGKSTFVINDAVFKATRRKGRYGIIAPMYDQARSIYWTSGMVRKYVPQELCAKIDEIRMIIYFVNGSTLEFGGSDNPRKYNKFRGAQFDWLWMDEFSDHDYQGWKEVFRYTIMAQANGFKGGGVTFTGTVKGENHLWQEYLRVGPNRASYLFRASETGLLSAEDIEEIRQECDGDESVMQQELECVPMFYSGLIYKEFGDHNILKPFTIPHDWAWGYALDHGGNNPTSFGVYRIDYDGNIYRVGEYYKGNSDIMKNAPSILSLRKTDDPVIADPSIWNRTQQKKVIRKNHVVSSLASLVEEYEEEGIDGLEKANNSVLAGINRMKKYIRFNPERMHPLTKQLGSPMFFVIDGSSPGFLKEIKNYRWKQKKVGSNDPEEPIKLDDHAMDECRYFLMSRPEHGHEEVKKAPTSAERMRQRLRRTTKEDDEEDAVFDISWDETDNIEW